MDINEFRKKLSDIKTARSITGKTYSSIQIVDNRIRFIRENKCKPESILISELFDLYLGESIINTTVARSYITGRVQSPAVAILNSLKKHSLYSNNSKEKIVSRFNENIADETKFFVALSELLGGEYIRSKSINKPIKATHIFLSKNYIDFSFSQEVYITLQQDHVSGLFRPPSRPNKSTC